MSKTTRRHSKATVSQPKTIEPMSEPEPEPVITNKVKSTKKTLSANDKIVLFIKAIASEFSLSDDDIKNAIMNDAQAKKAIPRGFPVEFGGKRVNINKGYPKRPSNSFILFSKKNREKVRAENPDINNKELISKLSELWRSMDADEKEEYMEMAENDKKRYNEEISKIDPALMITGKPKVVDRKPSKETAYRAFCNAVRPKVLAENPDIQGKGITKILIDQWNEIKESDIKDIYMEYKSMADIANKDYDSRLGEWEARNPDKKSKAKTKTKKTKKETESEEEASESLSESEPEVVVTPKKSKAASKTPNAPKKSKKPEPKEEEEEEATPVVRRRRVRSSDANKDLIVDDAERFKSISSTPATLYGEDLSSDDDSD